MDPVVVIKVKYNEGKWIRIEDSKKNHRTGR